jgi:two-component system sensor histidine kinase UhpB
MGRIRRDRPSDVTGAGKSIAVTAGAGGRSLFWRLFVPNAVVLITATAVLALSPATMPFPDSVDEALVILAGLALLLVVNLLLMRRAWQPLGRLTRLMQNVDPLQPGKRIPVYGGGSEVVELTATFNRMLDRLESERLDYGRRTLAAQEDERRRVARELHDEIGQTLTALMLQLGGAARHAPGDIKESLADATETARATVEALHRILRELRPEALDDLGLPSALATLADRVTEQTGLPVSVGLDEDLPLLAPEEELVVYRVAQEGLTNVIKHAQASRAQLSLRADAGGVSLAVRDDGRGMNGTGAGNGIRGMRERAMLVGASLELESPPDGGFEVRLLIPGEPR